MIVAELSMMGPDGLYRIYCKDSAALLRQIQDALDAEELDEPGWFLTVHAVRMAEEELDNMPEWDGV